MTAALIGLLATAIGGALLSAEAAWPQWGGPRRNFVAPAVDLATAWPAAGPPRLWERALGDGYSAIVTDGTTLYTMYRAGTKDAVVALDAATGRTRWESQYEAPFVETCSERLGAAPRSTPLIAGPRLITVSAGGLMTSFSRATGATEWTHDLLDGAKDAVRACGYSASPIAYKGLVITTGGGKGRGVLAIDATAGTRVWHAQDFENGYSSPILIDLGGRPELVVFTYGDIAGLNPDTGALEWRHSHPADQGVNVATPVWGDDGLLFVSSAYNGGSRVLRVSRTSGAVAVEEVWANKRVRIHFGNAVRMGSRVFGSSGDFGAAPFAAVDVATGEIAWRDRGVARATVLASGARLVILDEDGNLAIASPADDGLTIHAKAPVLGARAWTVPTLSGTTLYLRDQRRIVALDLSVTRR